MESSQKIVAWLMQHVRGSGNWRTTKDSSAAYQAVAGFSVRNYIPKVELDTRLSRQWIWAIRLSNNKYKHRLIPDLPVANGDHLLVNFTGFGTGILKIDLFYSRLAKEGGICPFAISPIQIKDVITEVAYNPDWRLLNPQNPCDVCGYCPEPTDVNVTLLQRRHPLPKCVQFSVRNRSPDNEARMSIVEVNLETGVSV